MASIGLLIYYCLHPYSSDIVMTSGLSLWGIDGNTHCTSFNTSPTIYFQVIAAEGEQKASKALRDASDVIAESSSALQLRYLQVRSSTQDNQKAVWQLSLLLYFFYVITDT